MLKVFRNIIVSGAVLIFLCSCGGGGSDDGGPAPSTNACGNLGLNTRIINGTACEITNSSVLRILVRLEDNGSGFCTGTLITPRHVLTAAHCFPDDTVGAGIVLGSSLENASVTSSIRVTVHPSYIPTNPDSPFFAFFDVAVLEFAEPFSLPTVPLLASTSVVPGEIVSIFGYGTNEEGNFTGEVLESGEMKVSQVTPNHIISNFEGQGSNTCQGDSGGPLLSQATGRAAIAGLTSSGTVVGCGAGDLSIFTNAQDASITSFILSVAPGTELV